MRQGAFLRSSLESYPERIGGEDPALEDNLLHSKKYYLNFSINTSSNRPSFNHGVEMNRPFVAFPEATFRTPAHFVGWVLGRVGRK